jgi:hypothetical protein
MIGLRTRFVRAIAGPLVHGVYLDGELCGVLPDGRTASNLSRTPATPAKLRWLFWFDPPFLCGEGLMDRPRI